MSTNKSGKNYHYIIGHYITHQPDSVHIEAQCTCGERSEVIGGDEGEAIEAVLV